MSEKLEQKIYALFNEIEQLNVHDRVRAVANFARQELNLMEMTHNWNEKDLALIKARAIGIMQDLGSTVLLEGKSLYQNDEHVRTYCFAQATYEYMRGLGMSPYVIGIQAKKDLKKSCDHSNSTIDPFDGKYKCLDCGIEVQPIGFAPKRTRDW